MANINHMAFDGNLARDPELRHTAGGLAVLEFNVAVNDRRKNQQTGEWEDCPNFIDCKVFGARAEGLAKIISVGCYAAVSGKFRWSQWGKNGEKRSKIECIVDEVTVKPKSGEPCRVPVESEDDIAF